MDTGDFATFIFNYNAAKTKDMIGFYHNDLNFAVYKPIKSNNSVSKFTELPLFLCVYKKTALLALSANQNQVIL